MTNQELPEVVCNNRQLRDKTGDTLHILYENNKANPEIFQRGSYLVRVCFDEKHSPYIDLLGEGAFRGMLTRIANFVNIKANVQGETVITGLSPPLDVVQDILTLKRWEFPCLLAITPTPIIRKDGSIVTMHGYDAETGFYYHGDTNMRDIPESPTKDDVEGAVALIKEVLWDFPFDSVGSRANAVAALITPVVRPLIDDLVPLAVFDKPQQGTGATMLCHAAAVIATGTEGGTMGGHRNDEEWRKNITSTLLKGYTVAIIDNVDGELYSPSLATALTTPTWKDRVLGHSEDALIPNTVCWMANGNNLKLKGDLPRRAYRVRLDAQEAQPWLRPPDTFLHPYLIPWLKERRGEILGAVLTLARAWVVAGKPTPQDPIIIGSFPRWCEVIGGILEYAGITGFLTNLQEMYVSMDAETPAWEIFMELWYQSFGAKEVRLAEVISLAKDDSGFANYIPDGLGNVEDKGFSRKLGKALSRREGVRFSNGYIIEKGEGKKHGIGWIVKPAGPKTGDYSFKHETPQNHPDFVAKREFGEFTLPLACNGKDENNTNIKKGPDKLPKLPSSYENAASLGSLPVEAPGKRDPRTDGLIEFWDSIGRPIIHLDPGENCEDLVSLLGNRNILPRHLEAVMSWAKERGWNPEEEPEMPDN
ncbi:MAG: hypothetical protein ACLFVA_05390 [Dehalococcoidia bacterium]